MAGRIDQVVAKMRHTGELASAGSPFLCQNWGEEESYEEALLSFVLFELTFLIYWLRVESGSSQEDYFF